MAGEHACVVGRSQALVPPTDPSAHVVRPFIHRPGTTTDPVVDRVARALTLLYVSDLRELQNDINDILVSAQAFTANPYVIGAHAMH